VKELGDDDSVFVGDIDTRIGNPFQKRVLATYLIVQNAVAANHIGIDV
jgi:hypothetical protein